LPPTVKPNTRCCGRWKSSAKRPAKRVPDDVQQRFPDIPWRQIIGMRNIIAHDYLGIRLSRVHATAVDFLPVLVARLPAMIAEVSP